jgi:hypothetical protein
VAQQGVINHARTKNQTRFNNQSSSATASL